MKLILPTMAYWNDFEDIICKLYKIKYPNEDVDRYGRNGQRQKGVDIYINNSRIGIQCKKKDDLAGTNLKDTEIEEEVNKAKEFNPKLQRYIICYTGQKDNKLQDMVNEINEKHKETHPALFTVELMDWEKISEEIKDIPELLLDYLGDVLKHVEEIKNLFNKANAKEKVHNILSNILEEFKEKPHEKPYMDGYSSLLVKNYDHLESALRMRINDLIGEIKAYKPLNRQEKMIMGDIEYSDKRGPIKRKLKELIKETEPTEDNNKNR